MKLSGTTLFQKKKKKKKHPDYPAAAESCYGDPADYCGHRMLEPVSDAAVFAAGKAKTHHYSGD